MYKVFTPTLGNQARTALAVNSLPLSDQDAVRRAVAGKQIGQHVQHVVRPQLPGDRDRQTFTAEFINHRQHAERPTVMGSGLDKVIGPDMVLPVRAEPDTRIVIKP